MSSSDARMFEELAERVTALEARVAELAGQIEAKDLSGELYGPPVDHGPDRAERAEMRRGPGPVVEEYVLMENGRSLSERVARAEAVARAYTIEFKDAARELRRAALAFLAVADRSKGRAIGSQDETILAFEVIIPRDPSDVARLRELAELSLDICLRKRCGRID